MKNDRQNHHQNRKMESKATPGGPKKATKVTPSGTRMCKENQKCAQVVQRSTRLQGHNGPGVLVRGKEFLWRLRWKADKYTAQQYQNPLQANTHWCARGHGADLLIEAGTARVPLRAGWERKRCKEKGPSVKWILRLVCRCFAKSGA